MHRDGIARQHRLNEAIDDEPLEIAPGTRVHHCGTGNPYQVAALGALLQQPGGELLVVDRPLPADLGAHEPELFVGAVAPSQEAGRVHHDSLAAVLAQAHGYDVALAEQARFHRLQRVTPLHDDAVHPGTAGRQPLAIQIDVGRQVGRREEPVGQDAVGGEGLKSGFRRTHKGGPGEVGQRGHGGQR